MMLYLKTKTKTVHVGIDQGKLNGGFLGWTHDLSCTHPARTKKKKKKKEINHLNVKAIVQS